MEERLVRQKTWCLPVICYAIGKSSMWEKCHRSHPALHAIEKFCDYNNVATVDQILP